MKTEGEKKNTQGADVEGWGVGGRGWGWVDVRGGGGRL